MESPLTQKVEAVPAHKVLLSLGKKKTTHSQIEKWQHKGKEKVIEEVDCHPSTTRRRNVSYSLNSNVESNQRKKIFTIKCMSGDHVYNVIIDRGSYEIMVSEELVGKLDLHQHRLGVPYWIIWFKKWREITIEGRCLITIQLGNYKDEVWWHVIPMDTCHLLLGYP